jgi:hypothetical protein
MVAVDGEGNVDIIDALFVSDVYVCRTSKAGLCLLTIGPVGLKVRDMFFFRHPYKKAGTR